MGHAPHPTQSLVNSCEEFYQAKQLFSPTQRNWHVLAQLQKVSTVPKCKNILRIAKKKLQGGQSSHKICSLLHGKINLCSQPHSRQAHLPQVCICEEFSLTPPETSLLCGVLTICTTWGFNSKYLQDEIRGLCSIISKIRGSITFLSFCGGGGGGGNILASGISLKFILVCNNPWAQQDLNVAKQKDLPWQFFGVATVWR